jgi:hypothetical protein
MTNRGHVSLPQLPTPIWSRIGVEVVRRARTDGYCYTTFGRTTLCVKLTRETVIFVYRCFINPQGRSNTRISALNVTGHTCIRATEYTVYRVHVHMIMQCSQSIANTSNNQRLTW